MSTTLQSLFEGVSGCCSTPGESAVLVGILEAVALTTACFAETCSAAVDMGVVATRKGACVLGK